MELNEGQINALKIAVQRFKDGARYTVISGPAGSGKSSTVRVVIESLGIPESQVAYATYTGKAAQVLQKKGNQNSMTLHKLLYKSIPNDDGTFTHEPLDFLPYSLVVVDEVSMAPKEMMELLFSHEETQVICLGDEHQLPPVSDDSDNHLLDHPHARLTEIMRQAAESEIIRVSADIRLGRPLKPFKGKEVQIVTREELSNGMLLWADEVICNMNKTRNNLNEQIRRLLGYNTPYPVEGDKMICLRNYWKEISQEGNALINGTLGNINITKQGQIYLPLKYRKQNDKPYVDETRARLYTDGNDIIDVVIDNKYLLTGEKSLNPKVERNMSHSKFFHRQVPKEFAYGYAITTWKSQGSEWDKVLVIDESFPFEKELHKQCLYTAVTRAAKKLVLVLNE